MRLEDDRYCFACGEKNKHGLHLKFNIDDNNIIHTEFTPAKEHQGFKDIVHGGIIGLVLDEVMVNLPWKMGIKAVSVEINVRLRNPAKVGEKLLFSAWIDRTEKKLIYTKAETKNESGKIVATASAKCINVEK